MSNDFRDLNLPSEPATTPLTEPATSAPEGTATSESTAASEPTPASNTTTTSGASAVRPPRKNRPVFGTIFWGVVLLTFAAFMVARSVFPLALDAALGLIGSVIVIGLLLVVAGIAAASRRAG